MFTTLTDSKGDAIFIRDTTFIKLIDGKEDIIYIRPDEIIKVKKVKKVTKFGYKKGNIKTKAEYKNFIELTLKNGVVEIIDMKCKEIIEKALYIKL